MNTKVRTASTAFSARLRRDRLVTLCGLVTLTALCWAYLLHDAARMASMEGTMAGAVGEAMMPAMHRWSIVELVMLFVMWTVMMAGMMVPSAAPMILMFARVNHMRDFQRRGRGDGRPRAGHGPLLSTGAFLCGYLAAWAGFSVAATLAQWGLHSAALMSPMMVSTSRELGAVLLLAAGAFQFTPLKNTCLAHCRSPVGFLATHWREGRAGAFSMGLHHGTYCVGCCWFLMLLLFVTGVMNLVWVAIIAGIVLLEKTSPTRAAPWVSRAAGTALILWGVAVTTGYQ